MVTNRFSAPGSWRFDRGNTTPEPTALDRKPRWSLTGREKNLISIIMLQWILVAWLAGVLALEYLSNRFMQVWIGQNLLWLLPLHIAAAALISAAVFMIWRVRPEPPPPRTAPRK